MKTIAEHCDEGRHFVDLVVREIPNGQSYGELLLRCATCDRLWVATGNPLSGGVVAQPVSVDKRKLIDVRRRDGLTPDGNVEERS